MEKSILGNTNSADSEDRLYAFSGIDGAGKSTVINLVSDALQTEGHRVYISKSYTQEHKDAFGQFVETADDIEMMFMFQAFNRRQRNNAMAHLAMGDIVLADRWSETYEEYHSQHGLLAEDNSLRGVIDNLAYGGLVPSKTFYVRTSPEIAIRRTKVRGEDFFDAKGIEYRTRQSNFYDSMAESNESWITLDGLKPAKDLARVALDVILGKLNPETSVGR